MTRSIWIVSAICGVSVLVLSRSAAAVEITSDVILDWNQVALEINKQDHSGPDPAEQGGPTRSSRALAIVHIAMYDAFVSIEGGSAPYLIAVPFARAASKEAAVAVAAHKALLSLYPGKQAYLDDCLTDYLASIPNGPAKTLGQFVGSVAAQAILLQRSFDGKRVAEQVPYSPSNLPGKHRPDPLNPNQGFLSPGWELVKTFAIGSVDPFMIPPPPALFSQEYTDAFNEVKELGDKNSVTRTQDQTEIGLFWAYDGTPGIGVPPRLYNQMVRVIADDQGNMPRDNARLFALVNIAMADSGIAAWTDKYDMAFWRPVIAIREADPGTGPTGLGDGNPNTVGDLTWEPLCAPLSNRIGNNFTPPFPAYASGHATFGAATFTTVQRFYGTDNIAFDFISDELNGVTTDNEGNVRPFAPRHFDTLSQAIQENADSRIYLGIHWRFDATEGVKQGTAIANCVFNTVLRPTAAKTPLRVAGKK